MTPSLSQLHTHRLNSAFLFILLSAILSLAISPLALRAAITPTGNVEPSGTWTASTTGYIGRTADGTLTVDAGSLLNSSTAYIASYSRVTGTATVTGAGSAWTNSGELYVGFSGNGTLNIEAGALVSNSSGYLGYNSGSTGTATVTDAGSAWINSSMLYVGFSGNGTLTIEAGAQVSDSSGCLGYIAGSTGAATVTGAGSNWTNSSSLVVGDQGNGTLIIESGAQVSDSSGYLGYIAGSSGAATVTGPGSKWTNSNNLNIGNFGSGKLTIEAGAQVSNSSGYLGYNAGTTGTATVTGAGSNWTNSSSLVVGVSGNGTLTIEAGAQVSDSSGCVGHSSGSTGTATVTGAGSNWTNSGSLVVGDSGSGTLTVEAGAQVSDSSGYLGYISGSTGTATVTGAGSKWTNSNNLSIGNGTLTVADGGEVTATTLYASLANLHGNGTITATEGAVLDANLRFDPAHPTQTALPFGSGGTLTVNAAGGVLGVGYKTSGTLTIAEGVAVSSSAGYLGYIPGSTGAATVTGAGSNWTNSSTLYVGRSGSGTLTIEAGAQVSNSSGYLGNSSGSKGIATVTGVGSTWTNSGNLYVGFSGNGTLTIEAGAQVSNSLGYLGYNSGSTGTATVAGAGSAWTNSGDLDVGRSGSGTLTIEAGAQVSNSSGYLGNGSGSTGIATVTGVGSIWTNSDSLFVGTSGNGTLHIRDAGDVLAKSLSIKSASLLTIDAGYGSEIRVGSGTGGISNSGTVRILTGPGPAAGSQFSPLAAGMWAGSGTYQALGGTWNASTHKFTVSQTLNSVSGTPLTIDLAQQQRVFVQDSVSGWAAGASFLAKYGTGKSFNFTATAVAGADLTSLQALLQPGQSVVNGWNLVAAGTGYLATDPIYLSLGVPSGLSRNDLKLWKRSGSVWTTFTADDLTAAGGYASFTITGVNNYAVTAALPAAAWNVDTDGLWQTGSNWTTTPNAPSGTNVAAVLGPSITAPRTITLAAPLTLGLLTFDSAQHYTLAGSDTLNVQVNPAYAAKITVSQSDANGHVIETPLTLSSPLEIAIAPSASLTLTGELQNPTGQTLTLSGGGTLTITQGLATSGDINVQSGTLTTPTLTADSLTIGASSPSPVTAVPEPSTLLLLLLAACGVLVIRRWRNQQSTYVSFIITQRITTMPHSLASHRTNRLPSPLSFSVLFALVSLAASPLALHAAIAAIGNVEPAGTWDSSTIGYIGQTADGTLTVNAGSLLNSNSAYIAYDSGVTGSATVTGANSKWTNSQNLCVGYYGNGALDIEAGAQVSDSYGYLGYNSGSTGAATVTGAGSKWTNGSDLYVGYYGNGALDIEAGGQVTDLAAYVGYYAGASGSVTVTGLGSTTNSSALYVGYSGNGALTIEAGAQVSNYSGYLGYNSGSTGTATVTGAGSKWTNSSDLYVGYSGNGTLTVADGGQVTAKTLYASLADLHGNGTITATQGALLDADLRFNAAHPAQTIVTFGSAGTLTVNAAGGILGVGYKSSGNLTIAEGITVSSSAGHLGYNSGSTGTATVTGAGSKWTSSSDLYVGYSGSGTLTVAEGGQVTAKTLYASLADLHGNGTITATQGALLDADLRFDAAHPAQTVVTFGSGGTLTVNAAGGILGVGYKGSGTLTIAEGITVSSSAGHLGYNSGSTGTATVTGTGSKWNNGDLASLVVGRSGNGTLTVEAGAQVSNYYGYLGYNSGSTGTATITGAGSKWINGAITPFYVGRSGNGTLSVKAGALVSNYDGYLGYNSGSTGMATVTGANSKWTNGHSLYVGYSGAGTLSVEAGALVSNYYGYLGYNSGSTGTATITGAGSQWTNSSSLYIGYSGNGTLTIEAGALVSNSIGCLGYNSGSTGMATVTGAGSNWTNPSGSLTVGYSGNGTLAIETGAQVADSSGYLGSNSGSTGTATVTGAGSKWTNSSSLYVGNSGNGTLTIEAGAQVSNGSGFLGYNSGSTGTATVTGTGSKWTNGQLFVGYSGVGTLTVEAGAQVSNSSGYVRRNSAATVTGTGSKWTNSTDLYVSGSGTLTVADGGEVTAKTLYASLVDLHGNGSITATQGALLDADLRFDAAHQTQATVTFGSGGTLTVNAAGGVLGAGYGTSGTLTIADGVTVSSSYGYLGYASATSGAANVTGAGSNWNSSLLHVGYRGNGTLTIEAGAQVSSSNGYLGDFSGSMGTATVTGAGSIWSTGNVANGTIFVGYSGNGAVIIEAGALVSNSLGYLGYNSGSTGTATVTGAGSKWTNTGSLSVGSGGTGMLTIEAGAQVSNSSGYLGFNSGATGMAVITGAGSKWTNSSSLSVGNSGKGTLHVRDGGNVLGSSLTVKSASLLTIDAGYGSEIRVGGGTGVITNNGTVQILTGPGPVAGLQSVPIVAGTWSGSGAYQAVGGTWNTSTHAFTISQTLSSVSATPVIIDLAQQQRVLVEDATSGWAAGASFLAKTGTGKRFDFTATAIAGIDLTSLQALLPPGQTVVNGWNLTADGTGYLATDPIYLSLSVPSDLSRHDVEIWKLTGTTWAPFTADDLTTADGYASFTTTGLSTYALTAVPEPSTLLLLFLAAASLFTRSLPKKSS